jgi:predicted DNA-binding transcriptional regulator YafY
MTTDRQRQEKMIGVLRILNDLNDGEIVLRDLAREMGISVRTIQRYICQIEGAGFPLYSPSAGVYCFVDGYSLKKMQLSDNEACLLVLMDNLVSSLANKKFSEAFKGLKSRLLSNEVDNPFYIKEQAASFYADNEVGKILEKSINKKEVIGINYFSQKKNKTSINKDLKPVKIACYDGFWYLICFDIKGKVMKFLISNIKSVELTNTFFKRDKNLEKILEQSRNIWFESQRDIEVKLLIDKDVARYFQKKEYFPLQKIKENKNGTLLLTCKVSNLQEIQPDILHWMPCIKIISPKNYAIKVKETIKNYLGRI